MTNGTATQQQDFTYDVLGNRFTASIGATTPAITAFVYDTANQLKEIRQTSASGPLVGALDYDPNGNPSLRGMQLHEIQPVTFGGSPTDPLNKILLTPQQHSPATTWWNQLQRQIQ